MNPTRRSIFSLSAARLVGALVVAVVAQFVIDMPLGYFGASDAMTDVGLYFCLANFLVGGIAAWGLYSSKTWAWLLSALVLSLNIGVFVPALATDPLTGAIAIAWQLAVLGAQMFIQKPLEPSDPRLFGESGEDAFFLWRRHYGGGVQHLAVVAMVVTVGIAGFQLSHHMVAFAACIGLHLVTLWSARRFLWLLYRRHPKRLIAIAIPLGLAAASLSNLTLFLFMLALFEVMLLFALLRDDPVVTDIFRYFTESPALFVLLSFAVLIAMGFMLLSFPASLAPGTRFDPVAALFTAVSAVCVTGLTVLDTGKDLSFFGQGVLLLFIQLGGLGIMVLYGFSALLFGGQIGLRGERALGDVLSLKGRASLYRLTRFIVFSTFAIESVGAALLTWRFRAAGQSWGEAAWSGVFHAISAFCNAGFGLKSDSLVMFQHDPIALAVFSILITLGGLGFMVLASLWFFGLKRQRQPLSVHVKLVLVMTFALSLASTLIILAVEWDGALGGLTLTDKMFNSLLHGVTLRTAGFNSLDMATFKPATVAAMLLFMFIGAAPGGTGGGIKVTTAGVLLAALPSLLIGNQQVRLFRRNIAPMDVFRSAGIAVLTVIALMTFFFLLLLGQKSSFEALLFEVVSAMGTVGLTVGATSELDRLGRYVIMLAMYLGRVGPLTAALALGTVKESRVKLPEESLLVG